VTEGNFVDYVKIHVTSGKGGAGSAHLHREKFIEKGGPDGGDGGRGGHIIVKGNSNLWTLLHLKFKRHLRAGHGGNGSKSRSTGADGEDKYIEVPLGTTIRDTETDKVLFEITEDQQEFIQINEELAEIWPNISEKKDALEDAEEWDGVPNKLQYLER